MSYDLFIDDERWPVDVTWCTVELRPVYAEGEWVVARTWAEVEELLTTLGMPDFISFDHDLGAEDVSINGYEIAKRIVDGDIDGKWDISDEFDFYVHSKNPIGKANIEQLMSNYLQHKRDILR